MFFSNRRHRLIYFCLAGMEMAWFTPFLLLLYRPFRAWPPLVVFTALFLGLLSWILILELLNRYILNSPQYELSALAVIGLSSLLLIRLIAYPHRAMFDLSWILHTLQAIVRFEEGVALELIVVFLNFFVWFRATNATSRDIDFWNVGLSFRLGMLLLILGGGLFHQFSSQNGVVFLWLYYTFGLTAIALTRIDEKATDTQSVGGLLPTNRLVQLLVMVGLTMTVTVWLSGLYTPDNLRAVVRWLGPLWQVLGSLILLVMSLLFWILGPILLWLGELIVHLFQNVDLSLLSSALESLREGLAAVSPTDQAESFTASIPSWVWTFLRYVGILLLLLPFLALIMIFLDRVRPRSTKDQEEAESQEQITLGGNTLKEGLAWLKDTAGLIRRYGLSRELLAAISVENIYANLCRLGRQQGYPRHPAQPPDAYLPVLAKVFAGQEEPLARITISYMRVHYGDHPLTSRELNQIREDYQQIRRAEKRERKKEDR